MDDRKHAAADAQFGTARTLHRQGRLEEAEQLYRAAIETGHVEAKEWLGVLCFQQGNLIEAICLLSEASAQCPQKPEYHSNLAAALLQLGRRGKAMESYRRAIDLDPHLRSVCHDTGQFLTDEERSAAIVENSRHILSRYPNYAPAHYSQACALLSLGQIREARRASERALVLDPTVPTYYHVLIHTGDPRQNANAVSALEELARSEAALEDLDRATLHFLLAKAYDDQKRTADAFAHLQKANAIKRGLIAYDEGREIGRIHSIAAIFTRERIRELAGSGETDARPVFVVGMPRSGTTLVEQILASHPDVHGAGELTFLSDLLAPDQADKDFLTGLDTMARDCLRELGRNYVAKLAEIAPRAKRIVDKQPYNFLHPGLIHMALPEAHIIHVRRDPLDTCFSCYAQTFAGEVGFAYDLEELGRYYRAYDGLMAHWREALPDGAMLEVRYEELVRDLPGEARRLVEYCGLSWDARCLEFHKAKRAVATASLYQVRQPLYHSSVGRAQAYAAELGPLRQALGLS